MQQTAVLSEVLGRRLTAEAGRPRHMAGGGGVVMWGAGPVKVGEAGAGELAHRSLKATLRLASLAE